MSEISFGDLVNVVGYGANVYQVDSYRVEMNYFPDEQFTETIYDLTEVTSGSWIEAEFDDLTLLAPADQADDYLAANPPPKADRPTMPYMPPLFYTLSEGVIGMSKGKEERQPTARELSAKEAAERKKARKERAEKVDLLLDEMNDLARLTEMFGDKGGDYAERLAEVKAELKELAEVER